MGESGDRWKGGERGGGGEGGKRRRREEECLHKSPICSFPLELSAGKLPFPSFADFYSLKRFVRWSSFYFGTMIKFLSLDFLGVSHRIP